MERSGRTFLTAWVVGIAFACAGEESLAQAVAKVAPTKPSVGWIERLVVDVDARPLRSGSNHRLVMVPAGTPDAVADVNAMANMSTPVAASKLRTSLPPAPTVGQNEIRLLYLPQSDTRFAVAARATIEVQPGTPGALRVSDLVAEAQALGGQKFNAKYSRDVSVEGQFLRSESWAIDAQWVKDVFGGDTKRSARLVGVWLGHLGTRAEGDIGTDILCIVPVGEWRERISTLEPGQGLVLTGLLKFRPELRRIVLIEGDRDGGASGTTPGADGSPTLRWPRK